MLEQAGAVLQDNSCKTRENPVKIEEISVMGAMCYGRRLLQTEQEHP
ncbi:hypothetical protein [uncultured Mitsuokella sp.]|nr:hypothetical protein [uncultured Mitsuokella sp.]